MLTPSPPCSKHHRTTYNMYMLMIAFFDVFVSLAYIPLMSVGVLGEFYASPLIMKVYYHYMPYMFTISHIAITTTSFLIMAAFFERFCITRSTRWLRLVQSRRKLIVFLAVLLGVVSKGTILFELNVSPAPLKHTCAGALRPRVRGHHERVLPEVRGLRRGHHQLHQGEQVQRLFRTRRPCCSTSASTTATS